MTDKEKAVSEVEEKQTNIEKDAELKGEFSSFADAAVIFNTLSDKDSEAQTEPSVGEESFLTLTDIYADDTEDAPSPIGEIIAEHERSEKIPSPDVIFKKAESDGEPIEEDADSSEPPSEDEHIAEGDEVSEESPEEEIYADEDGQYTLTTHEHEGTADLSEQPISEEAVESGKYDPKKPRKADHRFELVELFVFTLAAVLLVTTFFFKHTVVDGISMENTLSHGDHLIISDLFYTPKRGDIIVCEDYTTAIRKPIVKRVIAVAGDTIKITESGEVYVNGELITEDYVYIDGFFAYEPIEREVLPGEIFVMGDHRNHSTDSRHIGNISTDAVLGKVLIRIYPFADFGVVH